MNGDSQHVPPGRAAGAANSSGTRRGTHRRLGRKAEGDEHRVLQRVHERAQAVKREQRHDAGGGEKRTRRSLCARACEPERTRARSLLRAPATQGR